MKFQNKKQHHHVIYPRLIDTARQFSIFHRELYTSNHEKHHFSLYVKVVM